MKKLISLIFLTTFALAQNLNLRLTTTAYSWEAKEKHLRAYQLVQFTFSKSRYSLHGFFNITGDVLKSQTGEPNFRFYNFYIRIRNIARMLDVKLGRFSVYSGVGFGTIDGAYFKVKPLKYVSLNFYAGVNSPYSQRLKIRKPSGNLTFGAQFKFRLNEFYLSLSYFDKLEKPKSYVALRSDELGNVFTKTIDTSPQKYQLAGVDLRYEISNLNIYSRFDYDINNRRVGRGEISLDYKLFSRLDLSFDYDYRDPRIPANSIFSVFNYGVTKEIEAGVYYRIKPNLKAYLGFSNLNYVDESSNRIVVGFDFGYGSFNYAKRMGFAGVLDGFTAQVYYPMANYKITPLVAVNYSSYALIEGGKRSDVLTVIAGSNFRFNRYFSLDLQLQYLRNKLYSSDFRFFVRLSYWMFKTNLF